MKAILFDFDGTLADTAPGIVLTMQQTFKEMGLPIPEEKAVRQTIGLPLIQSVKVLGGFNDEDAQRAVDTYRSLFSTYEVTHITIFPEVKETLERFSAEGIRMAICTSRGTKSLESILGRHGLNPYFETKITASDNLPAKPAPDMVLALLERMHLSKDEVLVVGDTTFDIEMGNRAGCRTVAVTYGNHSREQLESAKPAKIINNFSELWKTI